MNNLQTSILKTLAYFDIFDCPLTASELLFFIDQPTDYLTMSAQLKSLVDNKAIIEHQGFYCLRLENIISRQNRYTTSRRKLKKSLFIARLFSHLPWIKFIGLANQIGSHNLRDGGDLDFFIITEPSKIWLTRFITTSLMALTGQRPTATKNQDQICLSFFITSDNLDLQQYMLADQEDFYFCYWLANLCPLYDAEDYYRQLIMANSWLQTKLPNWQENKNLLVNQMNNGWHVLRIIASLESVLKQWQLKHLAEAIKNSQTNNNVVISDKVLKLHVSDRRQEFNRKYLDKLNNINPHD